MTGERPERREEFFQVVFKPDWIEVQAMVTSVESIERLIAILDICKKYFGVGARAAGRFKSKGETEPGSTP